MSRFDPQRTAPADKKLAINPNSAIQSQRDRWARTSPTLDTGVRQQRINHNIAAAQLATTTATNNVKMSPST